MIFYCYDFILFFSNIFLLLLNFVQSAPRDPNAAVAFGKIGVLEFEGVAMCHRPDPGSLSRVS